MLLFPTVVLGLPLGPAHMCEQKGFASRESQGTLGLSSCSPSPPPLIVLDGLETRNVYQPKPEPAEDRRDDRVASRRCWLSLFRVSVALTEGDRWHREAVGELPVG